ncbi:ribonuclease Z [Pseudalgibacter alginicilyticus]|uniref:Ribonuclease Z n=1 Tax=Pseudalgibacter alginicilyticus TaxID=1736674 RepID=A0A0P0CX73_9FLAO|nr:GLPGLI family protein [Pseudalgibacter alginicilyticus]ALJ05139.1 ribonuclease Z [Pseudalgibacter alginicilyticus]
MNFNTIKASVVCLLFFTTFFSFAQKDFQGIAFYESKTSVDMSNFGGGQMSEERKKEISERMKSALEKTYTLTFNQSESMYKEEEKLEAPSQGRGPNFRAMIPTGGPQYKNVKDLKVLQEQEFFGKQFLIKDDLQKLEWELGSETKTIGQYMCFKATAIKKDDSFNLGNFGRRGSDSENNETEEKDAPEIVVTAWYTPQIPVNQGPDQYWGLPGLVLEVNAGRTTILCSKIILNPSEKETIKKPSKGKEVTQEEYDEIVKKKMAEMESMRNNRGGGNRGGGGRR